MPRTGLSAPLFLLCLVRVQCWHPILRPVLTPAAPRALQALRPQQVSPATSNATLACFPQDGVCSALSSLYNAAGLAPLNLTGWASAANASNTSYCTFAGVNCTNGTLTSMCVGRSPCA